MADTIYKIVIWNSETRKSRIYPCIYWKSSAALKEVRCMCEGGEDYPRGSVIYVNEEQAVPETGEFRHSQTVFSHTISE